MNKHLTNKKILISGGCGFVGRHLTHYLLSLQNHIYVIDDLSLGIDPKNWLNALCKRYKRTKVKDKIIYHAKYKKGSISIVVDNMINFCQEKQKTKIYQQFKNFDYIVHLASIVGGRELIENNPIKVGTDLAIDSLFFQWLVSQKNKPAGIIYASSSAAYPTHLQTNKKTVALKESFINFNSPTLGIPDLTYGWSKLSGEYLSYLAHKKYGLKIKIIRPFSGYGEDQNLSYPFPSIAKRLAKKEDPIVVWGTGRQGRDFIHIYDCITAMEKLLLDRHQDFVQVNIGTGKLTSFINLIKKGVKITKSKSKIKTLLNKPVGVTSRYAYMKKNYLYQLGWKPTISLITGLERGIAYQNNPDKDKLQSLYKFYYE